MIRYDNCWNGEFEADPEGDWVPYEVANELLQALKMLYAETDDYQRINHLSGHNNQCMRLARSAIAHAEGLDEPKD